MREITIDIKGKNTLRVLETAIGAVLILKEGGAEKPSMNSNYFYVVFNARKGFFSWSAIWRDTEMDNSLYEAGNVFTIESESIEMADSFNNQLKVRKNV